MPCIYCNRRKVKNERPDLSVLISVPIIFARLEAYEIFTGENDKRNKYFYKNLGYVETSIREVHNVSLIFMKKVNKLGVPLLTYLGNN